MALPRIVFAVLAFVSGSCLPAQKIMLAPPQETPGTVFLLSGIGGISPLGPAAVQWAMNVAWCESRYHPNSVNSDSGASGLFQFLPSTWGGTPYAKQSPFDPRANAFAAAWLYSHYGAGRWVCQG